MKNYLIRKDIITRNLASGTQLSIPVFHFKGKNPSFPTAYIQSSIHGSEVQGYLVCLHLIEHFSKNQPNGDVTIVPLANPYATDCKLGECTIGRFDTVEGHNWNRNYLDLSYLAENFIKKHKNTELEKLVPLFKKEMQKALKQKLNESVGYYQKLALQLQILATQADLVLDLHCSWLSLPFVFSPNYLVESAALFGFPFIIKVPPKFAGALDEAIFYPWFNLQTRYNDIHSKQKISRMPIESFTIELGNTELIDSKLALEQSINIQNYLEKKGKKAAKLYSCELEDLLKIYAPKGGLITEIAPLDKKVKKGEPLVSISSPAHFGSTKMATSIIRQSTTQVLAKFDCIPIVNAITSIVHEGMTIMFVMTKYQKL